MVREIDRLISMDLSAPRSRRISRDTEVAPLAVPAMAIGSTMVAVGALGLISLPDWAADYGRTLVYLAFVLYLRIATRLIGWGIAVRRAQLPD